MVMVALMNPSSMLHHVIAGAFLLILFPSNLSAAPVQQNMISLYNQNDKVVILVGKNFSSTVYQSETAWLVEFYASWCGHCQHYAKTYREIGIDTWEWRKVVRVGAINCYSDENNPICDEHGVKAYPTVRFIEPNSTFNASNFIPIPATDAKNVERELIMKLEALHRKDPAWPNFTPMNLATLDDLINHIPSTVKLILVIVEKREDFTGRQIMLDFSKYHKDLVIFRTAPNATLWQQRQISFTDTPLLFAIFPNRTIEQIQVPMIDQNNGTRNSFNRAIRSYVSKHHLIPTMNDEEMDEAVLSKNVLHSDHARDKQTPNGHDNAYQNRLIRRQKLSMVDLETALSYMLRREIPRYKDIRGEAYDALVHWLIVLTKYFPGREPVMMYLKTVLSKVQDQPNGLTSSEFRNIADENTETSYLPNNQVQYYFCAGSAPQHRGYPCGLWTLFHTLTVAQVQRESRIVNVAEIPTAVRGFIKHFFGCEECSKNFMKETRDIGELPWKEKNEALIYLWKVHNSVNRRLHQEQHEDPQYPKVQFPPATMCSKCRTTEEDTEHQFDLTATVEFLLQFYSKENIDLSMVQTSIRLEELGKHAEEHVMLELNDRSGSRSGFFGFLKTIFGGSSFYFFFVLVIVIVLIRKRHFSIRRRFF